MEWIALNRNNASDFSSRISLDHPTIQLSNGIDSTFTIRQMYTPIITVRWSLFKMQCWWLSSACECFFTLETSIRPTLSKKYLNFAWKSIQMHTIEMKCKKIHVHFQTWCMYTSILDLFWTRSHFHMEKRALSLKIWLSRFKFETKY